MNDYGGMMARIPGRILSLILYLALALTGNAIAQTPNEWLARMDRANGKYNYQGTLVHLCDGVMDVVHVVHRVDGGLITERITSQSSGGRQIIRNADEVMCILPDQKKVVVEHRDVRASSFGPQISGFPSFSKISKAFYEVTMFGKGRVAGHETVKLAVRPVDQFRYGYRLWLDRGTALPLKFELVDGQGKGLEHGVFTDIHFYSSIPEGDIEPTITTEDFEWEQNSAVSENLPGTGKKAAAGTAVPKWHAERLPPGFELVFAESIMAPGDHEPVEQLVYSDGLATISVFIETSDEDAEQMEGMSKLGATNAFSTRRNGYLITAMGGVPLDTARLVALSVSSR